MKKKNKLDEMQEQKLLRIEHNGCWFAFWALIAAMLIQMAVFGVTEFRTILGEWVVFMALSVYLGIACLKNGIWDRRLEPNRKTNLAVSLIAASAFSAVWSVISYIRWGDLYTAVLTFGMMAVFFFVLCFAGLTIAAKMYQRRFEKLEQDSGDEEN